MGVSDDHALHAYMMTVCVIGENVYEFFIMFVKKYNLALFQNPCKKLGNMLHKRFELIKLDMDDAD